MNNSTYRLTLDMHESVVQKVFNIKKNDNAREFKITLTDNGKVYQIADGCTATFRAKKPDGTILFNNCSIENNVITYILTNQTSSATGDVECEVTLYDSEAKQITSPRFGFAVMDTLYDDSEIESTNEFTKLTETMAEVGSLPDILEGCLTAEANALESEQKALESEQKAYESELTTARNVEITTAHAERTTEDRLAVELDKGVVIANKEETVGAKNRTEELYDDFAGKYEYMAHGVKGNNEANYRYGDINLSIDNISQFDSTPTLGSHNLLDSDAVQKALSGYAPSFEAKTVSADSSKWEKFNKDTSGKIVENPTVQDALDNADAWVNKAFNDLDSTNGRVATNEANIATNTSDIATNASNISAHSSSIEGLQTGMGSLAEAFNHIEQRTTSIYGGTSGQILAKKSDADYDYEWVDNEGGVSKKVVAEIWKSDVTYKEGDYCFGINGQSKNLLFRATKESTNIEPNPFSIGRYWEMTNVTDEIKTRSGASDAYEVTYGDTNVGDTLDGINTHFGEIDTSISQINTDIEQINNDLSDISTELIDVSNFVKGYSYVGKKPKFSRVIKNYSSQTFGGAGANYKKIDTVSNIVPNKYTDYIISMSIRGWSTFNYPIQLAKSQTGEDIYIIGYPSSSIGTFNVEYWIITFE